MRQVIDNVRGHYASLRNAERARRLKEETTRRAAIEAAETERRKTISAALARIPPQAREIPLADIDLSTRVLGHLERAGLETVWDVMERLAEGDEGLLKLDGIGPKSLAEIKQRIDVLMLPEVGEPAPAEEELVAEVEGEVAVQLEVLAEERVAEEVAAEKEAELEPVEAVSPSIEALPEVEEPEKPSAEEVEGVAEVFFEEEEEMAELLEPKEQKKGRRPRRELVYDEELGEVVALRRRKRESGSGEFEDW